VVDAACGGTQRPTVHSEAQHRLIASRQSAREVTPRIVSILPGKRMARQVLAVADEHTHPGRPQPRVGYRNFSRREAARGGSVIRNYLKTP
jgi:hypothetical protein